jgi:hypothetical protein
MRETAKNALRKHENSFTQTLFANIDSCKIESFVFDEAGSDKKYSQFHSEQHNNKRYEFDTNGKIMFP